MNYITTSNPANRDIVDTFKPPARVLLILLLIATWSLLRHYKGLSLDGELYAFQAMAKLYPGLRSDVYLMGNSQDQFTFFSPLYALFIRYLGLWSGSVVLFALCTITFIVAAWSVARCLWDETRAWLSAAACIVIVAGYGAYSVFTYAESYLTARSLAEAMVAVALALHLRGLCRWGWAVAAASMFIHPLMALPGLLLLACLSVPIWYATFGALCGVISALIIAWLALHMAHAPRFLTIIGGDWLEMVRERSQYLFLQQWRYRDWEANAHPVLSLALACMVTERLQVRRVCIAAILVGVSGLLVALIASGIGPVAILLQGQAWRWFWVTALISVLTLAPTAIRLWQDGGIGSVCATLLVASWTFPAVDGTYMAAAALGLWCLRDHVQRRSQWLLRALACAMILAILAWTVGNIWSACMSPPVDSQGEPLLIERLRSIYLLQIPALAVFGIALHWLRSGENIYASGAAAVLLFTLCVFTIRGSFERSSKSAPSSGTPAFSAWREAIPPASNVLVVPSTMGRGFIWFTLERPSYLTVDQSAGVVFSEKAAQEIRRRSQVLLPIMEPDWRIMSQLARAERDRQRPNEQAEQSHPLTAAQLSSICRDSQLGFVIAKERLGFDAIPFHEPGPWKDWNLYDCSRVRQRALAG